MAAAAPVKVFGPPISPAVSRVLACLIEKDVRFQLLNVNMAKGEHKSPDFLKLQPFGQVPAFQDGNVSLFGNFYPYCLACPKPTQFASRSKNQF